MNANGINALRLGSLFSGYTGLDMAVTQALGVPVEPVWHSDIKPAAVTFLAHRHPGVPNLGDMRFVHYGRVPRIDVLAASWPCQPHSSAGKRLGEDDPRALWPYVRAAITAARPAYFFGENVARIRTNGELRRVVQDLAALGYVGAYRTIRASDVGACHRRDRCFLVAVDAATHAGRGWAASTPALPVGRGGSSRIGQTESGGRGSGAPDLTLLPTPAAADGRRGGTDPNRAGRGAGGRTLNEAVSPLPTLPGARADRWGVYAAAIARHELAFGRPAPEPTQISARTGKPQLTPTFVEWMMGLPQGWVTDVPGLTRNQQLSMLGDGVVPLQGAIALDRAS